MSKKQGNRFNKGKLRWRNIPMFLLEDLIKVGTEGEKKYGTYNFLKGLSVLDCLDSLKRHLECVDNPDKSDFDKESGAHHLAHVMWNAMVALYMIKKRPELDDRLKNEDI